MVFLSYKISGGQYDAEISDKTAVPNSVSADPACAENSVLGVQRCPVYVRVDILACGNGVVSAGTVFGYF